MFNKTLECLDSQSFLRKQVEELSRGALSNTGILENPHLGTFFTPLTYILGEHAIGGAVTALELVKRAAEQEEDTREWFNQHVREGCSEEYCLREVESVTRDPDAYVKRGWDLMNEKCPMFLGVTRKAWEGKGEEGADIVLGVMLMLSFLAPREEEIGKAFAT